jgi:protein-disulfide isomerase
MRRMFAALALTLTGALMATTTLADGIENMTDAERAAFQKEVRDYLIAHPEVLVEAMDALQAQQQAQQAVNDKQIVADNQAALLQDANSWVGGNPDGDITVVEFMDYRCGYCRKAFSEVEELVKADGNIRFVVKEFPILGEDSVISSRFAVAVRRLHGDEAYKKAHDALITLRGQPDQANLGKLASDLGLDANAIFAEMQSDEVTNIIKANHAMADKLQISGTPTFVVGDQVIRGYMPLDAMQQLVADERAG